MPHAVKSNNISIIKHYFKIMFLLRKFIMEELFTKALIPSIKLEDFSFPGNCLWRDGE